MEFNFDHQLNSYWMSFVHGRFEFVLSHCFDSLLIQSHAEMTHDVDVLRIALAVDNELNRNAALEIGCTSFWGEFRINRMKDSGRTHAAADAHHAAAITATAS